MILTSPRIADRADRQDEAVGRRQVRFYPTGSNLPESLLVLLIGWVRQSLSR